LEGAPGTTCSRGGAMGVDGKTLLRAGAPGQVGVIFGRLGVVKPNSGIMISATGVPGRGEMEVIFADEL